MNENYSRHDLLPFVIIGLGALLGISLLGPIWNTLGLHVPGETNTTTFLTPVDSMFYVRNAVNGYVWAKDAPTSLWFHPVASVLILANPLELKPELSYYLISQVFAIFALSATSKYINTISSKEQPKNLLLLILLLPGGISIATGNTEFICLAFTSLLFLALAENRHIILIMCFAGLAILTKPNALYLLPSLSYYFFFYFKHNDRARAYKNLLAALTILGVWLAWMMFVDFHVGELGAYWEVRQIASVPLSQGPLSFFHRAATTVVWGRDFGETVNFAMALLIPVVGLAVTNYTSSIKEEHKIGIMLSMVAMVVVTLLINNPNKIMVYAITIPGYFPSGALFLRETLGKAGRTENNLVRRLKRRFLGISYVAFCLFILVFFIIGTPLEWYY